LLATDGAIFEPDIGPSFKDICELRDAVSPGVSTSPSCLNQGKKHSKPFSKLRSNSPTIYAT
jgi:hypothetical protein